MKRELNRYKEFRASREELKNQIELVREAEKRLLAKYREFNESCIHNLILKLDGNFMSYDNVNENIMKYEENVYYCLCCNKEIKERSLNELTNVIDITKLPLQNKSSIGFIPSSINGVKPVSVFIVKAQEILNQLASFDISLSYEELKQTIIEGLLEYDKNLSLEDLDTTKSR